MDITAALGSWALFISFVRASFVLGVKCTCTVCVLMDANAEEDQVVGRFFSTDI